MRPTNPKIDLDLLRKTLSYDPISGQLSKSNSGERVGSLNAYSGYRIVWFNGRQFTEARLIWMYVYGEWPDGYIDHVNGDQQYNRLSNLRDVTQAENMQNQKKVRTDSISGIQGVRKEGNGFLARIRVDGKLIRIGLFNSIEEATIAHRDAKIKYHPFTTIIL